jgi:hypothetical protein
LPARPAREYFALGRGRKYLSTGGGGGGGAGGRAAGRRDYQSAVQGLGVTTVIVLLGLVHIARTRY